MIIIINLVLFFLGLTFFIFYLAYAINIFNMLYFTFDQELAIKGYNFFDRKTKFAKIILHTLMTPVHILGLTFLFMSYIIKKVKVILKILFIKKEYR